MGKLACPDNSFTLESPQRQSSTYQKDAATGNQMGQRRVEKQQEPTAHLACGSAAKHLFPTELEDLTFSWHQKRKSGRKSIFSALGFPISEALYPRAGKCLSA